jgi:hypothetical protein
VIDSEELLVALCGRREVDSFKEVKLTYMRLARVVKEVIAADLGGELPVRGKQFLTTPEGLWRLATRANSDNSTEARAHRRAGARSVQVFGEVSRYRRGQGWMSVDDLYAEHGLVFDSRRLLKQVIERLS